MKPTPLYRISMRALLFPLTLLCLVMSACDDSSPSMSNGDENPHFTTTLSLGEVTVWNDVCLSFDAWRTIAVGYRDSLADGTSQPIIVVMDGKGNLLDTTILSDSKLASIRVINYDTYTHTFIALGEGSVAEPVLFRISTKSSMKDSVNIEQFTLPFQGNIVHPTEILPVGDGDIALSGWIDDADKERGFLCLLNADNTIQWMQYFDAAGIDVRCENIVADDSGYVLAITETNEGTSSVHSYLQTVTSSGTLRERKDMNTQDFRIRDLVWHRDTGYSVVGAIEGVPQTGYIALLDYHGNELWIAPLEDDSTFIPIHIVGSVNYILGYITGNIDGFGATCSMELFLSEMRLFGLGHSTTVYYVHARRGIAEATIIAGIEDFTYSTTGTLLKATAIVIY